jgi:hypothetical protein
MLNTAYQDFPCELGLVASPNIPCNSVVRSTGAKLKMSIEICLSDNKFVQICGKKSPTGTPDLRKRIVEYISSKQADEVLRKVSGLMLFLKLDSILSSFHIP